MRLSLADTDQTKNIVMTQLNSGREDAKHRETLSLEAKALVSQQKAAWELAGENYRLLQKVRTRTIHSDDLTMICQFNPGRIRSSAANTSAAALGAPLMHDYAVISLSDLMTPWEQIKNRAKLAAEGDFVIAIYNPKSRGRATYLDEIRDIVLQYRKPETPVGIVRKAGRPGMNWTISTLEKLPEEHVDMQSTVIIGKSTTFVADGKMITPRGYKA